MVLVDLEIRLLIAALQIHLDYRKGKYLGLSPKLLFAQVKK